MHVLLCTSFYLAFGDERTVPFEILIDRIQFDSLTRLRTGVN